MVDFAVPFLHQYLPVLTNSLSDFAHADSNLSSFIPRGSNQWNCTHISAFSPLPSPMIFSWLYASVFLLQTELIYCSAFSKCIQTFQVIFFSHALQVPTVDEFRQCLLSTVSNCCCKVIQQGFLCHWLDKCFCHFPENFFLLLSSDFSPFWLSVM